MLVQFSCGSGVSMLSSNLKEEVHIECLELLCYLLSIFICSFIEIFFSMMEMCYSN